MCSVQLMLVPTLPCRCDLPGDHHIPVHLIWGTCMGKERLVYEYRPVMPTGKHDIIDNGVVPSICIYIYHHHKGCAPMRSCTVAASLGREQTLNMHGGGGMPHFYVHTSVLSCISISLLVVGHCTRSSWLRGSGMQALTSNMHDRIEASLSCDAWPRSANAFDSQLTWRTRMFATMRYEYVARLMHAYSVCWEFGRN